MKLNRQRYLDKVYACWTGKNIGGTMGTPYESSQEMNDIHGFNSRKGEPLPNDDLDLQLIWMCAVEERGIRGVTPQMLGEYWISYIPPHWNEYGISKANMKLGLLPPYSGEYANELWKNSNGAWIRTELWACLFPGFPELATRYAYNDACVDHGKGEGTNAAIFIAAMESLAFYETDVYKLINSGLSYIPEDCRVAQSVRCAIAEYEKGTPFREARNNVVANTADLGWFQAPANVSFVILGLLYAMDENGKVDYKQAMINAINCGDDTDCTGATIGSLMGIMYGSENVPGDWAEYIGDRIQSCACDLSYHSLPKTIDELTRRVYELVPSCLKAYGIFMEYTDGENELEEVPETFRRATLEHNVAFTEERVQDFEIPENGMSQNIDCLFAKARVEFDKHTVSPGDEIEFKFHLFNTSPMPKRIDVELILPDGWATDKKTTGVYVHEARFHRTSDLIVKVTVGEVVNAINKITAIVSSEGHPSIGATRIVIFG